MPIAYNEYPPYMFFIEKSRKLFQNYLEILLLNKITVFLNFLNYIGIRHGFSCINIHQVPWEVLKTEAEGHGFQHLLRDLANVNALKNHVPLLLLHKTENICYISCYFLYYFVSPFHQCLANIISTDYASSRAGQYTSCNGSKSVAPVRSF